MSLFSRLADWCVPDAALHLHRSLLSHVEWLAPRTSDLFARLDWPDIYVPLELPHVDDLSTQEV